MTWKFSCVPQRGRQKLMQRVLKHSGKLRCTEVTNFVQISPKKRKLHQSINFFHSISIFHWKQTLTLTLKIDDPTKGGVCTWKSFFRFKHLSTGTYLAVEEEKITPAENSDGNRARMTEKPGTYFLKTVEDYNDLSTVFELSPTVIAKVLFFLFFPAWKKKGKKHWE